MIDPKIRFISDDYVWSYFPNRALFDAHLQCIVPHTFSDPAPIRKFLRSLSRDSEDAFIFVVLGFNPHMKRPFSVHSKIIRWCISYLGRTKFHVVVPCRPSPVDPGDYYRFVKKFLFFCERFEIPNSRRVPPAATGMDRNPCGTAAALRTGIEPPPNIRADVVYRRVSRKLDSDAQCRGPAAIALMKSLDLLSMIYKERSTPHK